jgi:hypothetical protein
MESYPVQVCQVGGMCAREGLLTPPNGSHVGYDFMVYNSGPEPNDEGYEDRHRH